MHDLIHVFIHGNLMSKTVTITTTPEGAEIIRASIHFHALDAEAWAAADPDNLQARRIVARVRSVQRDVQEGIRGRVQVVTG